MASTPVVPSIIRSNNARRFLSLNCPVPDQSSYITECRATLSTWVARAQLRVSTILQKIASRTGLRMAASAPIPSTVPARGAAERFGSYVDASLDAVVPAMICQRPPLLSHTRMKLRVNVPCGPSYVPLQVTTAASP